MRRRGAGGKHAHTSEALRPPFSAGAQSRSDSQTLALDTASEALSRRRGRVVEVEPGLELGEVGVELLEEVGSGFRRR